MARRLSILPTRWMAVLWLALMLTLALALVAGALFIAAAMTHTGLDRRIALVTLTRVGTSTRGILLGAIAVTILLSLVVPSATARSACVVPIMMGVVAAFGVDKRSNVGRNGGLTFGGDGGCGHWMRLLVVFVDSSTLL